MVDPDDDTLVADFLRYGADLLQPYFDDEKKLHTRLKLITEALRNDDRRWEEAGKEAIKALVHGMTFDEGRSGARKWAEVVEPLFRAQCSMVPDLASKLKGDETLGTLLRMARVVDSKKPDNAEILAFLAAARSYSPMDARTHDLSCFAATLFRNKHAHGQWSRTGWRERLEIAESVLLTLLRIIDKHPVIERAIVFRQARLLTRLDEPKSDFRWSWRVAAESGEGGSAEFAAVILARVWSQQTRLVIRGPRGVGLSRLGRLLTSLSIDAANEEKSLLLVTAKPEPSYTSRARDDDGFMAELLGGEGGCWHSWWVQIALERGWLGIVLEGLERLDGEALLDLVKRFEDILRKWPQLRLITLRPDILPVAASSDRPNVLGTLAKDGEMRVEGRLHPEVLGASLRPLPGHPATLAYWLKRGAAVLGGIAPDNAVRTLLDQELAFDHDQRWPNVNPARRKVASVMALNALFWFVEALDEEADEARIRQLERERYNRVLKRAFRDVLGWYDSGVEGASHWNTLLGAVDSALGNADLVGSTENVGPVWIAHPSIEECARADDYQKWVRSKWDDLAPMERVAVINAALEANS